MSNRTVLDEAVHCERPCAFSRGFADRPERINDSPGATATHLPQYYRAASGRGICVEGRCGDHLLPEGHLAR